MRKHWYVHICFCTSIFFTAPNCSAQWTISGSNIYAANTGNVGIGSSAPVYKLEVLSQANARLMVRSAVSPNPAILEVATPVSTGAFETVVIPSVAVRAGSRTNHDFALFSNNIDRLVVKSDGRIGIGKSNPAYSFDVNGVVNASAFYINNQPLISPWTITGTNISYNLGIVSIGTATAPIGYKLAVGGKMVAEEIVVKLQSTWPDYVLRDDYPLLPLIELKKFILENERLPEIPSASDVIRDGLRTGAMNTLLLKKIEELTLYIIEQQDRITALEKKVQR